LLLRKRATDIARKQWAKVAEAIQDPADALIVEGYPALDPQLRGIAVFTLSVTTKRLQAAKRQTEDAVRHLKQAANASEV
jgi:molybdopterin-guanine dinucleotide biosynthesis protein